MTSVEEEFSLHKWQECYFKLKDAETQPSGRAEAVRGILAQAQIQRATDRIPPETWSRIYGHNMKLYAALVDCCDTTKGINNYAEGALNLAGARAVDSSTWQSCISLESMRQMDCVQNLIKTSEQSAKQFEAKLSKAQQTIRQAETHQLNSSNLHSNQSRQSVVQSQQSSSVLIRKPFFPDPNHTNSNTVSTEMKDTNRVMRQPNNQLQASDLSESSTSKLFQGGGATKSKIMFKNQSGFSRNQQSSFNSMYGRTEGNVPSSTPSFFESKDTVGSGFEPQGNAEDQGPGLFPGTGRDNVMKRKLPFGVEPPSNSSTFRQSSNNYGNACFDDQLYGRSRGQQAEDETEESEGKPAAGNFKTAKQQLVVNNQKKHGNSGGPAGGLSRRVLGVNRRNVKGKFVSPVLSKEDGQQRDSPKGRDDGEDEIADERLKNIDPKMIELIKNEIMDHGPPIQWDDIAGLEFAKTTIKEIVVWPMLRPDIFHGLRGPPKGLLLFGPPGTGKTLIGKCIASQSNSTFFSISASSLTSKWVGEGEKMVRALFVVARCHQPAVIFIDEIDSLLSQRSADEHESSRRIKTEFLVQLDGATTGDEDRLLIVGATNRPQEIDEAARRRLVKRLYIPLPEAPARKQIIKNLLYQQNNSLSDAELDNICQKTSGYSGADMANLCREAALGPIRSILGTDIQHITADEVRPILHKDFIQALDNVRPSVSQSDLDVYIKWNKTYGSGNSK